MPVFGARCRLCFFIALAALSSACLVRHRTVVPPGKTASQPLLNATKQELIERVHAISDPLQSFQMKVEMSPSVGDLFGGQVTDYPTISGVILFRRPADIRVVGLDPVVHGTAFDMLSLGNEFKVSIPPKNQFITGREDVPANSTNKLENLRPSAFRTSLFINPPDDQDLSLLEEDTDETNSVFILLLVRHNSDNTYTLHRSLYFDRHNLNIVRQVTFDEAGMIVSKTRYADWHTFNGIRFPTNIVIQRPKDGYELDLKVLELKINTPDITPNSFELAQPPNAQVKVLN